MAILLRAQSRQWQEAMEQAKQAISGFVQGLKASGPIEAGQAVYVLPDGYTVAPVGHQE